MCARIFSSHPPVGGQTQKSARPFVEIDEAEPFVRRRPGDPGIRCLECGENLRRFPASGRPGRVLGTRELVVSRTPYIVPYRVRGDMVELLLVLHAARKWPSQF